MTKKDKLIHDGIFILNNLKYISCQGDHILQYFLDSKVDGLYSDWLRNIKTWLKENKITQSQSHILFMNDTEFSAPYQILLRGSGFTYVSHKEDCLEIVKKCTKGVENKIEELKKINTDEYDLLDYDCDTKTLHFCGKDITITERVQSDADFLLRTIFKEKNKIWNTYEILDDWKIEIDNNSPKNKVYQAGKTVNRIVAQETNIKDFLIVTTKTVCINNKYL